MNLDNALVVASGGLANINRQMSLISQNVANASTPAYAVETSTQQSLTADGQGLGVHSGPAVRDVDIALQGQVLTENATVAGLQTRQMALQALDATQGTPGQGGDLASLLGDLQNQFSTLLNSPDNQAQQAQVVSSATTLAQSINNLSTAYTTQRQTAQDSIVAELATLNTSLATIGSLSDRIVALKTGDQSTADLENQRDAALGGLSQLVDVKVLQQPSGGVLITTDTGFTLPLNGSAQLSTSSAAMQPDSYYPGGGIPPITLGGVDITRQLQGGQIGANIALRDTTLPTDQAELDEFAQNMASRFAGQGLTLFTDPTGAVPAGGGVPAQAGYVGFAGIIQVNAAVQANPAAVRDGTPSISGGLAGFTGIITAVLNNTLGSGLPLASNVAALGPGGNLNAPYAVPATLGQLASTMLAAQSQESATTTSQLGTEQAVQTTLGSKLSAQSGVNMDAEMSLMIQLQNAYGANARVIASVQAMWSQLLNSVS